MHKQIQKLIRVSPPLVGVLLAILIPNVVEAQQVSEEAKELFDRIWVLMSASLVFLMQLGFLAFEIGCIRKKNTAVMAMKNIGDWLITSLVFSMIGFGLMFGASYNGFFGWSLFGMEGFGKGDGLSWEFFLFQLAFAGTAATIISGAMAERTGFKAYLAITFIMGSIIYPVFGHWVWGNGFISTNEPWLTSMGFIDFAGSSVVHGVGAWCALVGIWFVGPRIGRYREDGTIVELENNNILWCCIGVLVLWFGWWGFNGGSLLEWNENVGLVVFNTNLAGSAAGIAAFIHASLIQKSRDVGYKTLGGILGGLVAITACCHIVTPLDSVAIGLLAGVIHNMSFDLVIKKWKLDDVVGAIPVHGFCGVWGILSVAIFGESYLLPHPMVQQLKIQAIGALVCFLWSTISAFILFALIKMVVGIRVSSMLEISGLTLDESDSDSQD